MSRFVENPVEFSAACAKDHGQCSVERENIVFLDEGTEHAAVAYLEMKCGYVVITPDVSNKGQALLYHTSCQRMTDVVSQIFKEVLQEPTSLPQSFPEMTVGELHCHGISIPYNDCKERVRRFNF